MMLLIFGFFGLLLEAALGIYMLPTLIAYSRRHRQLPAIAALNAVGGFSGAGWVAALTWSLARSNEQ